MTKEQRNAYQRQWRAKNPDKVRATTQRWAKAHPNYHKQRYLADSGPTLKASRKWKYFARYGITEEQRDAMFVAQGSRCAACGTFEPGSKKGWATDHSHTTGKIRGIICAACNTIEGHAKGNPTQLRAVADYIERTNG